MGLLTLVLLLQTADPAAEGLKALEERKYEQAEELFAKATQADAQDYSAWFHLALAQSMLGKDADAAAAYRKVLELKPGLYEAELNLGIVLLRQKDAGAATSLLQSAAGKKPNEFRPRYYLAEALLAAGDFAQAEREFLAALELDPKSAAAEAGLARSLARQKRLDESAPHFRKAAAYDPAYKDCLLELASLYEAAGKRAEAIELYRLFPDNVAARERMGELLLESGRTSDAIAELEAAHRMAPTNANRVALAVAYLRDKQPERGAALLREAVEAEPQNLDLRLMYGRALRDQRLLAEAARQFAFIVQRKPEHKEAWNELAGALIVLEQYPQALAALEKTKELGGESPAYFYFRAIILDKLRDLKAALECYQKFLEVSRNLHPDEEFKARQRIRIIQNELGKR
jgi:tetratricopeptide (TPR) repeat protein